MSGRASSRGRGDWNLWIDLEAESLIVAADADADAVTAVHPEEVVVVAMAATGAAMRPLRKCQRRLHSEPAAGCSGRVAG